MRRMRFGSITCASAAAMVVLALALPAPSQADEARLKNGDRVSGKLSKVDGDALIFESETLGKVKVPAKAIDTLSTDAAITVAFKSGGYATGRLSSSGGGVIRLTGDNNVTSQFAASDIKAIYPAGQIPASTFKWSGRINVGASKDSGNSDTSAVNVDGEARGRGERDELIFTGELNRETADGSKTVDDSRIAMQYNRIFQKDWYAYAQTSAERDEFAELNLRTTFGVGAGHKIIETDRTNLSLEAGPSYVYENYKTTADRDYPAARWAVTFDTWMFNRFAQLFHYDQGLVNLREVSDVNVLSRQGVRVPFRESFNLTAQVNVDYDSTPAPGAESWDIEYLLSLGYSW